MREITPESLSLFIPAITASVVLNETGVLRTAETVLVTAAAGAVGSYAVQLAKLAGNVVVGTCSDNSKARWLRTLGCDRVINYRSEDMDAILQQEYPHGINLVVENVGRQTFDIALKNLAPFGRLVSVGAVSEYGSGLEWQCVKAVRIYQTLLAKSATLTSCILAMLPPDLWARHLQRMLSIFEDQKLTAAVDPTKFVGLEAVCDAVEHLLSGKNRGKVMVRIPDASPIT